jgi:tRNA(Ile)-lysidine synthase
MPLIEDPRNLEPRVLRYLSRHGIPRDAYVLVALSGGPDSVCLLRALHGLRDRHPLRLRAAYFDHGIRCEGERRRELELVRATCSELDVGLSRGGLPQGQLERRARSAGRSLEELARQVRYQFLERAASEESCDYIAVGHTADDQVETVVMRFFQGAGPGGLPGIPERRDALIRPLWSCTRAQVLSYLSARGAGYLTDSTNRDERYLRNAVRRELLPAVERIFPGFRDSVLSLAERLARLRAHVEAEAARRLIWKRVRGGYRIPGGEFLAAPGPLRLASVMKLLPVLRPEGGRVPYRFLSALEDDGRVSGRRVVLSGYGIRLAWRGRQLLLAADIVGHREKGYFIGVREGISAIIPEAGLVFDCGRPVKEGSLLFRSRRTGDKIALKGGGKSVRELFSGWGVTEPEGWKIPILEGREGILAVFGSLFGYEDRFRSGVPHERGIKLKSMVHRYDVEVE